MTTPLRQIIPNASTEGIQLIKDMLLWNPQKRPNAAQCLRYPFFMVGVDLPQTKVNAQRGSAKKPDDIRRISDAGKPVKPLTKKNSGFFDDYDFDGQSKENRNLHDSLNNGSIRRVSESGMPVKPLLKKKTSAIFDDFDIDNLKDGLQQSHRGKISDGGKGSLSSTKNENNARVHPVKNVESDSFLEYGISNLNKSHHNGKRFGGRADDGGTGKDASKTAKLPYLDNVPDKNKHFSKENRAPEQPNRHHTKDYNNHSIAGGNDMNSEKNSSVFGGERRKWKGPAAKRSSQDDDLENLMNEIENSTYNSKPGAKVTWFTLLNFL